MDKGCRLDPISQLNFHTLIDQGEIKTWDVLMSIFRCACCCGPRERWSVDAWLWHPDNDELCCSLLCQCMLLVLSQISVHYAFINDPVDLVSTGFEMEHFKHGEYWVAWNDLKCVVRRLLFPMRPAVPYLHMLKHQPTCERGRQSRCGSTPLSFKIRIWLDMNMIWQRRDHVVLWCNVYMLDACEPSGPAVSKLAVWPLTLYCLDEIHLKRRSWKRGALRPFTSAVWYFSFAKFYPLTEVDM